MKRFQTLGVVLVILFAAFPFQAPQTIAAPSDTCLSSWEQVASPVPVGGFDYLNAVDGFAPDNVWAVGSRWFDDAYPVLKHDSLVQHWDGAQWSTIPSPNVSDAHNRLFDVTVISPTDAWTVGSVQRDADLETLTLHWDGSAWTIVPSPNGSNGDGELLSVAGEASDDVWAAGRSGDEALLLHWNGAEWQSVLLPVAGIYVRVISGPAGRVWAMSVDSEHRATILSWDGDAWSSVTMLEPPDHPYSFQEPKPDFVVLAENDIWAAGTLYADHIAEGRLWHWNGGSWTEHTQTNSIVSEIAGVAVENIWTLGIDNYQGEPIYSRWNGAGWSHFSMEKALPNFVAQSITAVSADELWIVGFTVASSNTPNASGILHGKFTCTEPPAQEAAPVSPVNDTVHAEMYPTFDWHDVQDTSFYNLQVNPFPAGESIKITDVAQSEFQLFYPELPNGNFTWRVQSCNYIGCGEWSEDAAFSMQVPAPDPAPNLLSPESGVILEEEHITLQWSEVPGTRSYNYQVFQDTVTGQPARSGETRSLFALVRGLDESKYVWRVQACNSGGCSPWAEAFEFTIYFPTPGRPTLQTPAAKATVNTPRPSFGWQASEGSTYFQFQLRYGSRKGPIVNTLGPLANTRFRWKDPLGNGKYFWRVQACNAYHRCSKWSKGRKFFVQE